MSDEWLDSLTNEEYDMYMNSPSTERSIRQDTNSGSDTRLYQQNEQN